MKVEAITERTVMSDVQNIRSLSVTPSDGYLVINQLCGQCHGEGWCADINRRRLGGVLCPAGPRSSREKEMPNWSRHAMLN